MFIRHDSSYNNVADDNDITPRNPVQSISKHKEEGRRRRQTDQDDREKVMAAFEKHSHPLTENQPFLYNSVNGQVAPQTVNVQNALEEGIKQRVFYDSLITQAFQCTIQRKVVTMEAMKKSVIIKGKPIYDMEALFARILIVGQQCGLDLKDLFMLELCPIPPFLMD